MNDSKVLPARPLTLLLIAVATIFSGAIIGGSTNAINGAISPTYFRNVIGWGEIEHVWRACIAQGIFQGLIFGLLFSVVFTLVVGCVSRARCPFSFAFRYLVGIVGGVYAGWIIGGFVAIGLAALSPEFFQRTFFRVPEPFGEILRYAWVGGSIWGALFSSLLAGVLAPILFIIRWRQMS